MTSEPVHDNAPDEHVSSRRRFLKMGGIGAAAAAATTAAGAIVAPRAAFASGTMQYDATNTGSADTILNNSTFKVSITNRLLSGAALYGENNATGGTNGKGVQGYGGIGVYGSSNATGGGTGVYGVSNSSQGIGVYGTSNPGGTTGGVGVQGDGGSAYVTGVVAKNALGGTALFATSTSGAAVSAQSTSGPAVYANATGAGTPLILTNAAPAAIPPSTGSWAAGTFLVKGGHLYYCYQSGTGTASKWAKVSGSYVPLSTPWKAYDSTQHTKLSADTTRAINLGTKVPAGARAAVITLSALSTAAAGWLTCYADGGTNPKVQNLSWWGKNQRMSSEVTVRVSSAAKIRVGNGPSGCHFRVAVLGYFL